MNREQLKQVLENIQTALLKLEGEVDFDHFENPATEEEVLAVEKQLGFTLPTSFRDALLTISSHVFFFWQLPDEIEFDEPNHEIFSGHLQWDLQSLASLYNRNLEIIETIYNDATDEYDAIWLNKLPFLPIGNGDYFAFDLQENKATTDSPIVYLSHDGSENHGLRVADNFTQMLEKLSQLAFVGAEDWQWEQFTTSRTSGIDLTTPAAIELQRLLQLN